MGQTLTHGIYLPDEGERNCYNGLAGNWTILDGAVGTIAEHTTALSGKAPLVHTHTKSDITDFPAYGTTAGTICEGNDSRLSDARMPVAHTHTKSDVTDLLNSNFIPSANNSYDLGSSSYQWKSVYAESYYYNGNEFQNKFVTLDTSQTISGLKYFSSNILHKTPQTIDVSTNPAEVITGKGLQFVDNTQYWGDITPQWTTDGTFRIRIAMTNYNTSGTSTGWFCPLVLDLAKDGAKIDVWSTHPNANLGTSTNKFKTLNGVNPGALSLPRGYTEEGADKDYINIASVIQTLDGTLYNYTMPDNGWISVRAEQATQVHVTTNSWKFGQSFYSATNTTLIVSVPFRKGDIVSIKVRAVTLEYARFYPMQGNV